MRYMFLIYRDEKASEARSETQRTAGVAAHTPYIERLRRNGRYAGSERLAPASAATVLRSQDGKPVVTTGPFAESREQFGGFYVIEADDLDQALAEAADCPALRTVATAVEVRPILVGNGPISQSPLPGRRFLFTLYETAAQMEDEESRRAAAAEWGPYLDQLQATGHLVQSEPLAPSGSATTLRLRDGKIVVTDGPFAQTREQIGGYCLVQARDIDEAVKLAADCPRAKDHAIEVRPVA